METLLADLNFFDNWQGFIMIKRINGKYLVNLFV